MDMKVIERNHRLCTCCMEKHEVKTVLVQEQSTFKDIKTEYEAEYYLCDVADEFYMDERQMSENDIRLKNAYRKKMGLLTGEQIKEIRAQYTISQSDLCMLLGWGQKTITRYESHQVQDQAHDTILRKLAEDPEWFQTLLEGARKQFTEASYQKYHKAAIELYEQKQDIYLRKAIEAGQIKFKDQPFFNGNRNLSLDKVIDVIRYFAASSKVTDLFKVKLMKLMWYADTLSYKRRGIGMTGLVYQALPMGAVPVSHNLIIDLQNIPCEEVDFGNYYGYHFSLDAENTFPTLSTEDKQLLDEVIEQLGNMTKNEIVAFMHQENAYKNTAPGKEISYQYAKDLQI